VSAWEEYCGRSYDAEYIGGQLSDVCAELMHLNDKMARIAVALERVAEIKTGGTSP